MKVISLLGGYGSSVITALTAQNTLGVQGIFPVPVPFVEQQLLSVLSDIGADAVKTGMLAQAAIMVAVARAVKKFKLKKLVLDPVMVSESGHALLEEKAEVILRETLFPLAGLITPNLREASILVGKPIRTMAEMKKAARLIKEKTPGAVLIKGGHLSGSASDLWFDGTLFREFSCPRIRTPNTHGTGCTFASAITTYWGQGFPLVEAVEKAKVFISRAISGSQPLGKGHGPTDPYAWFEMELERFPVIRSLEKAFQQLQEAKIGHLIPEVQSNLGYALPLAQNMEEVAAWPGRILRFQETIATLAPPAFGASRHVARIILTVMAKFPDTRSAMNIRFSEELLRLGSKIGFKIAGFDRRKEPPRIKNREGSSLSWGVSRVLENTPQVPDIIFDRGDIGKEPMLRVLGRNPGEVVEKILKLNKEPA